MRRNKGNPFSFIVYSVRIDDIVFIQPAIH